MITRMLKTVALLTALALLGSSNAALAVQGVEERVAAAIARMQTEMTADVEAFQRELTPTDVNLLIREMQAGRIDGPGWKARTDNLLQAIDRVQAALIQRSETYRRELTSIFPNPDEARRALTAFDNAAAPGIEGSQRGFELQRIRARRIAELTSFLDKSEGRWRIPSAGGLAFDSQAEGDAWNAHLDALQQAEDSLAAFRSGR